MPIPAAGQQPEQMHSMQQPPAQVQAEGPGQAVPGQQGQMQPGQMQPGQMQPGQNQPRPMQPGQMQQGQMQPGPMQPGQMQPGPMQPGPMQPGQMQPGQMQPEQMQPGQMQPGQMQPGQMQAPLQQQQGAPLQFAPQQQQGVPMQGMQGQPYMQAAPGQQPTYMQQAPAFPMGQPLAPGMQAPPMGQMPAAGQGYAQQAPGYDMAQMQGYSTQAPAAGQVPAGVLQAAPAAAQLAASEPAVTHFQEEWVNIVGLTGVVLQGPFLQQFGNTGKVKASMVLGVLARATGDSVADAPRPILVEAWGERAHTLAQQVKAGALLSVLGHLALDMRRQESSPSHGPALTVGLDSWELVTPATVPSDRAACAYKGEYDGVLQMITGGGRGGQQQGQWQQGGGGQQQQQQGRQKPEINKQQVMQMFMQGMKTYDIAQSLNNGNWSYDVFAALVEAAEEQGAVSAAWAPLLAAADLAVPGKAVAYYNAVAQAVQQNRESLTKAGHVRMKVVRDFLLSPQCQLSQEVQQQETSRGGVNKTYGQVRLLLAMIRVNIRP